MPGRLHSGYRGCVKAVGGRLLAVGNAVGGCDGVWECLWGMVRAGALGEGGGASSDSLGRGHHHVFNKNGRQQRGMQPAEDGLCSTAPPKQGCRDHFTRGRITAAAEGGLELLGTGARNAIKRVTTDEEDCTTIWAPACRCIGDSTVSWTPDHRQYHDEVPWTAGNHATQGQHRASDAHATDKGSGKAKKHASGHCMGRQTGGGQRDGAQSAGGGGGDQGPEWTSGGRKGTERVPLATGLCTK